MSFSFASLPDALLPDQHSSSSSANNNNNNNNNRSTSSPSSRRMPRLPGSSRSSQRVREHQPTASSSSGSGLPLPRVHSTGSNASTSSAASYTSSAFHTGHHTMADWNPFAAPPRPAAPSTPRHTPMGAFESWDRAAGVGPGTNTAPNVNLAAGGATGAATAPPRPIPVRNWQSAVSTGMAQTSFANLPIHPSPPPLMGLGGGSSGLRRSPLHRGMYAKSSSKAASLDTPQSAEWSLFGVSCVWDDLARRLTDMETEHNNQYGLVPAAGGSPNSQRTATPQRSNTAMSMSKDPFDCLSVTFGGERWHLALIHPNTLLESPAPLNPNSPQPPKPDDLLLYLSCGLLELDYSNKDVAIPATINVTIFERPVASGARPVPIWEQWSDFIFAAPDDEYFKCPFPSISSILQHSPAVRQADSVVVQVQIQSPFQEALSSGHINGLICGPRLREAVALPTDALSGLAGLLDDPNSSDVRLYVHETMERSVQNQQPLYRKRVLLAHSSILKARSSLFRDMLDNTDQWSESAVEVEESSGRKRRIHHVSINVEFSSMYWVLSWLYKDSIIFDQSDQAQYPEELAEGLIEPFDETTLGHIGWEWQPLPSTQEEVLIPLTHTRSAASEGRQSVTGGLGRFSPVQRSSIAGRAQANASGSLPLSAPSSPNMQQQKSMPGLEPRAADPHEHPCGPSAAPSALAIYAVAHFVGLASLCRLAQEHLVAKLTPSSAFPLLMSTHLYDDLHAAIISYTLAHWSEVRSTSSYERTLAEIGEGVWAGNDTLLRFTKLLSPSMDVNSGNSL